MELLEKLIKVLNTSSCDNIDSLINELKTELDKAKAFDIINKSFDISLDSKLRISDRSDCVQTFFIKNKNIPKDITVEDAFYLFNNLLQGNKNE